MSKRSNQAADLEDIRNAYVCSILHGGSVS